MKKLIIFITLLLFVISSFGQQSTPASVPKNNTDYLSKSKKQKTTAWILLGGGIVTTFVGLTQWSFAGYDEGDADKQKIGSVLIFTGLAVTIASIPFFIAAKRNKNKAASLSFNNMMTPQIKNSSLVYIPIPAVSLKIRL